ncbi:hypothetical protein J437_LFUL010333 [Ladona fulva]|uniref:Nucleolar protein of 40 kDa n=1 Tax=Ladona fulva TaxID=123851 RepID=A0A8K0NXX8_LADFU|nr:hypothetical protein J437_LFUL010333 [Ladona fulva]
MSTEHEDLLNTIFIGEVATVQDYGAFVRIPGNPKQGLIHRSQISSAVVDDAADVLQKGDRVFCKVISVTDGKIGLSMKYVNQDTGKDKDPNGVELQKDEQRRKVLVTHGRKKIELDAVFNTTCSKCGTRGHMSRDCFKTPDGKSYELLPEEDDTEEVAPPPEEEKSKSAKPHESGKKTKKKKKEKKKKHKKKKKRKSSHYSSDSEESSDSSSEEEKHRKEKKRHSTSGSSDVSSHKKAKHR